MMKYKFLDVYIFLIFIFICIFINFFTNNNKIWNNKIISFELNGETTNKTILDIYSFSHFYSGIILNIITNNNLFITLIISILFEYIENSNFGIKKYRSKKKYKNYKGDSFVNILSDIILLQIGFHLSNNILSIKKKIFLIILFEILLHPFHANLFNTIFKNVFTKYQ